MINSIFNIPQTELNRINNFTNNLKIPNCNILITGGSGFIGKWIIDSLNSNKNIKKIILLTRSKKNLKKNYKNIAKNNKIIILQHNLADKDKKLKINIKIKYIFHLACSTDNKNLNNFEYIKNINYYGTKKIIKFAKEKNIKKIFFSSSGATNLNYNNYYGLGKIISENLLICDEKIYNKLIIARMYTFFGPLQNINSDYAICNFINNIKLKKNIIIKGNGKNLRNYMYIVDLIKIIFYLSFSSNKFLFTDIVSNNYMSILELAKKVKNVSKSKVNIKVNKISAKSNDYIPNLTNLNYKKLKEVDFNNALQKTLDYYRNLE